MLSGKWLRPVLDGDTLSSVMDRLWRWLALRPLPGPEPEMTLPRSAADVLSCHVTFEVECIDRMYLNVYVPQLQYATGLVSYIHRQLGKPVASTAALAPVSEAFSRSVRSFAASCGIPWVDFAKGQRKDDVAREYLAGFTGTEGVLFIGRAQEKVPLFRTRKRRRADGSSYPWIAAETGVVNQYYCYCVDDGLRPVCRSPGYAVFVVKVLVKWLFLRSVVGIILAL